jgi:antitoxin component of MazEF toxin-antitoxin module
MFKIITKAGNSQGLVFDTTLQGLTRLKAGDQVNLTVHAGGTITITPIRPTIAEDEVRSRARSLIKRNNKLFKRLARVCDEMRHMTVDAVLALTMRRSQLTAV